MEFIELLTKVWLETQSRERESEEWNRRREERQWNTTGRTREGENIVGRTQERENAATRRRPCPDNRGPDRSLPVSFTAELDAVLRQFASSMGSLNREGASRTSDGSSQGREEMPPSYSQHCQFSPPNSSSTALKRPTSPIYADEGQVLRSPKPLGVALNDHIGMNDVMTSDEKVELQETIRKLTEEQEVLKTKIRDHDERLLSLLNKKPSLRRKEGFRTSQVIQTPFPFHFISKGKTPMMDEATIDAQIEHLYANLCRIHFPLPQKTAAQCIANNDATQFTTPSPFEMALYEENQKLREKVKTLTEALDKNASTSRKGLYMSQINVDNNIESLKFTQEEMHGSMEYQNLSSSLPDTTDNNLSTRLLEHSPSDVDQVFYTFEWNIPDYSRKLVEEKWGKVTNTVSKPFHIGHCGYLARLEAYLNGTKSGHGKYLSVFLRVIKGGHDDLLSWPVRFSVSFILADQSSDGKGSLMFNAGLHDVFQYDKPCDDTFKGSTAWGLMEFVPHSDIKDSKFIRNDSIKLMVDITKC